MKRIAITLALLGACDKSSPAEELTTPDAAARCQLIAIRAKSIERWKTCLHPVIRDEADAALHRKAKRADFWSQMTERAAPLVGVKQADFTLEPVPADKAHLGDQAASFRLAKDSFHVVRKDGRWYIVDTGI
jgi:hypothetical protein